MDFYVSPLGIVSHYVLSLQDFTDTNTGAVKIFSLDFLNYQFERTLYEVSEGDDSQELTVLRRDFSGDDDRDGVAIFHIRSMDRNAEQTMQSYIAEIFDVEDTTEVGIRETVASMTFSSTATGQYQVFPMQLSLRILNFIIF